MKQLVCEMCGGTELVKQDGLFVCQSCNAKYSVEEAKKMMVEGVVEVKGTVQVDNSHLVINFLTMAQNAYEAGNQSEAEMYCNKIIEIEPNNYHAWLIKGQSAGWQSTLGNIRFFEAANCFSNAIEYSPEDQVAIISDLSNSEISSLSAALISLRCDRFEKYPDNEETIGFSNDLTVISQAILQFMNNTGLIIDGILESIASQITDSVYRTFYNKIKPEYVGEEGYPGKFEFDQYIERLGYCITLTQLAINIGSADSENDIQRYNMIIEYHEDAIEACSYDWEYATKYDSSGEQYTYKRWFKEYTLTPAAIQSRQESINECRNKIEDIEIELIERKAEEMHNYWDEHPEEYEAFLKTQKVRENQIAEWNQKKSLLLNQKNALLLERSQLGVFAIKQKKEIDAKVAQLDSLINTLNREYSSLGCDLDEHAQAADWIRSYEQKRHGVNP